MTVVRKGILVDQRSAVPVRNVCALYAPYRMSHSAFMTRSSTCCVREAVTLRPKILWSLHGAYHTLPRVPPTTNDVPCPAAKRPMACFHVRESVSWPCRVPHEEEPMLHPPRCARTRANEWCTQRVCTFEIIALRSVVYRDSRTIMLLY